MTTTLEALKSPFNSVTISFLAARSTCSLRLTACYLGEPNLGEPEGNKPPVCDLPPALSLRRNDAPHALPPQAEAAAGGLEVRTVAGSPPLKIFTRLCRHLHRRIKPSRDARAPAVSDRTHPVLRMDARLPAKTDDLRPPFQMNPNRTPERNKFLITRFVRKRTKARRR